MNKKGFTLIEILVTILFSASAIAMMAVIPNSLFRSYHAYTTEVQTHLAQNKLTLAIQEDLSTALVAEQVGDHLVIGTSIYTFDASGVSREADGRLLQLTALPVVFKMEETRFTLTSRSVASKTSTPQTPLALTFPRTHTSYPLKGGTARE